MNQLVVVICADVPSETISVPLKLVELTLLIDLRREDFLQRPGGNELLSIKLAAVHVHDHPLGQVFGA